MTLVLDDEETSQRRLPEGDAPPTPPTPALSARMDQYDDDEAGRARTLSNLQVLRFISGYWRRRVWRVLATVLVALIAIAFETYTPTAAKGLVDLASRPPSLHSGVWTAWAWYVVALKDIAQSTLSHAEVVVVVVLFCIVMYGLIELPLLGFVFAPEQAADLSRRFSAWLGGNSRRLAVWVLVAGGCYLIARGFLAVA